MKSPWKSHCFCTLAAPGPRSQAPWLVAASHDPTARALAPEPAFPPLKIARRYMEILNITIYIYNNIYIYLYNICVYLYIYKYGSWSSQSQFFTRNSWTLENSMYVHKYSAFIHIYIWFISVWWCQLAVGHLPALGHISQALYILVYPH
jgi:hypothetical protein